MHSKLNSYFHPSSSRQRQSLLYGRDNLASEESDYYGSTNNGSLRFIIIRHGERVDATYGAGWTQHAFGYGGQYYPFDANMPPTLPYRTNWLDYEVDTPVTANGFKQSWYVGNNLARNNLPITACYSSPAIRSIQTADAILGGTGQRGHIPIRVELGLFECGSWYAQTPINFMSDQELINGGFNIDTRYQSHVKNLRLLEDEYQYYDRSKETMKKIIKLHRKTGGTILIVAHAPSLEVLTRHLMRGQARPDELAELASKVNYCSMTIVEGEPSSKSWQFRYSLDPQTDWQQQQPQQQLEYANNTLDSSNAQSLPVVVYHPSATFPTYIAATPTYQFQVVPQQQTYSPYIVV